MRQYHYTWYVEDRLGAEITVDKEEDVYTIALTQNGMYDSCFVHLEQTGGQLMFRNSSRTVGTDRIIRTNITLVLKAVDNPRPETLFRIIE